MFEIGRLCVKIAGRDAGMKCVIIDVVNKNIVLIDGQTRRRKCNVKHLEPLKTVLKVSKNAPRAEIIRVFKTLKIVIKETKPKPKTQRTKKTRKKKQKPVKTQVKSAKPVKAKEVKPEKPVKAKKQPGKKVTENKT
jgi:large subunit ribosomal protein L14e